MRNSRTAACAVATVAALATAGCAAAQPGGQSTTLARVIHGTAAAVPPASPRALGAADTRFGLDLLRAWCRQAPASNIVFSPESLAAGLGLAYLGARGTTAAAMARALHLPAAGPQAEADTRAQQSALAALNRRGVTLAASNRVWADPALPPRRSYLDAVATAYGAGLSQAPLTTAPARAVKIINAAIAHDTRGHIPALLSPGALTGDIFVLTDALYLDARWATPFESSQTRPGPFTTAAGPAATVRFMHGSGYRYATTGGWTAVSLPYQGGELAMTALLPPPADTTAGTGGGCAVPSAAMLAALRTGLAAAGARHEAGIALPVVDLGTRQDMNSLLSGLGLGIAFSPAADFTGLSPQAGNISLVEHAATLQVGEQGTVGSAATAAGIMPSSAVLMAGPQIAFDRPYLLLVSGVRAGEPLFVARVADPAAKTHRN
jgi:serine protease inhibitor